jgi:hypothetical protein
MSINIKNDEVGLHRESKEATSSDSGDCFLNIVKAPCDICNQQENDKCDDESADGSRNVDDCSHLSVLFKISGILLAILDNITDLLFYNEVHNSNKYNTVKNKELIGEFMLFFCILGNFVIFSMIYHFWKTYESDTNSSNTHILMRNLLNIYINSSKLLLFFEDFPQIIMLLYICYYYGFGFYSLLSLMFSYGSLLMKNIEVLHYLGSERLNINKISINTIWCGLVVIVDELYDLTYVYFHNLIEVNTIYYYIQNIFIIIKNMILHSSNIIRKMLYIIYYLIILVNVPLVFTAFIVVYIFSENFH